MSGPSRHMLLRLAGQILSTGSVMKASLTSTTSVVRDVRTFSPSLNAAWQVGHTRLLSSAASSSQAPKPGEEADAAAAPQSVGSGAAASEAAASAPPTASDTAASPGSTSTASSGQKEVESQEEWTEVVHQETGQTYYWNQRTGQTTDLGEPRPSKGGGSGQSSSYSTESDDGTFNPRGEAPLPDRTATYGAIGIFSGIFLGWAAQFF